MSSHTRSFAVLLLGFALAGAACSGGEETRAEATPPVTQAPAAQVPDNAADLLLDLFDAQEQSGPTLTTTAAERLEAQAHVAGLIQHYFEDVANQDWDSVYQASSAEFLDACTEEVFANLTAVTGEPIDILFSADYRIFVVGNFATGRFQVRYEDGTLPIEGLLAVLEADGWRMALNPCDVAAKVAEGDFNYPVVVTTTTLPAGEPEA